ncbi:unnamed protein product [Xylocopa violacea]|uniref:Serine hydroxymethyltransferase n=1 Tax=Xylocopa violacea TaxID=135666 RepID=A0ABP1NM39_XYLVO
MPKLNMVGIIYKNIWETDPELFGLMKKEKERQECSLEMIASENFTSLSVLQCLGSCLHNKYSEGLPGQRYYGGNEYIDEIERLAQKRALEAFNLNPDEWGCNVQAYSGSPANFAVYTALAEPHGRIMGLDLPDGGHLTHGFFTEKKKISATSIFFESMPYKVNPETGLIDYDKLAAQARLFKPKIIIAVAAGLIPSPFEYSDVVSTTTHKTLRGPRAGVIFFRKGVKSVGKDGQKIMYDLEDKINQAVFPGLQGGPHNHAIAGIATTMKQVKSPEFLQYQKQIIANAKRLCSGLQERGYKISTGGTDVHMLLVNLRSTGITGAKAEKILESISIACNKNTVPGDKSALNCSGIRLGTPALTTRGLIEKDMDMVVDFIHRGLLLSKEISNISGPKLVDYRRVLSTDDSVKAKVAALKEEVETFSRQFRIPGFKEY